MSDEEQNIIHVSPSAPFYFERAIDAYNKKDFSKGIKYFKRGISLASNPYEEHYGTVQLSLIYQHSGDFGASYNLLSDLIDRTNHIQPDLYYFQAVNCSYLQYHTEAKALLETFIDLLDQKEHTQSPYRDEAEDMLRLLEDLKDT